MTCVPSLFERHMDLRSELRQLLHCKGLPLSLFHENVDLALHLKTHTHRSVTMGTSQQCVYKTCEAATVLPYASAV